MYVFNKTLILTSGSHALGSGDLFFESLPIRETVEILKGGSNNFSSVSFVPGSSYNKGSLIVGGFGSGGIVQVIDLENKEVLSYTVSGELVSDNIEDLSI